MAAAGFDKLDAAKLLIERGADVNANNGATALMFATLASQFTKVEKSPGDVDKDLAKSFETKFGVKFGEPKVVSRSVPRSGEMARFLIENGADIDAKDRDGSTPLLWAFNMDQPRWPRF